MNWHWSCRNGYFIIVELKWDSQHRLQKKTWKTFVATTQSKTSATSLVSTSVAMVNPRRSRRFMNLSEVALRKNMEKKALKIGSQTWWFCHNQVTSCSWTHIILGELWLTLRYAESFRMGKVIWLYHHVYISIEHQVFDPFSSWLLQFVSSQQIGCIPYPWLYLKNIMMAYSHQNKYIQKRPQKLAQKTTPVSFSNPDFLLSTGWNPVQGTSLRISSGSEEAQ